MTTHPPKPPPRVVTKPHTERSDNTYLEGGLLRHIPVCVLWPAVLTLSVCCRMSGLRDCFRPAIPCTHTEYVPASTVLRLSPIVLVVWPVVVLVVRLVVVWVQQRPRHVGRGLLAGVPALGFGWLVGAGFAGHR